MLHAGIFLNANFFNLPHEEKKMPFETQDFSGKWSLFVYLQKRKYQEHLGKLSFFFFRSPAVRL